MRSDHTLARTLARDAGELLLRLRDDRPDLTGRALGAEGDRRSHEWLTRTLRAVHRADAVLSEEGVDAGDRHTAKRVWIVDPLDGTREYAERDRDDWAVHVALVDAGQLTAGAVALPAKDTVLATDAPPPAPPADPERRLRIAISRGHRPAMADRLRQVLDFDEVPMGSAGAKTAAVLTGAVDAYVHDGGQYEWDSAAPVAVARAAGAHASRLDGTPLVYNQPSPYLPDLLVCLPASRDRLLAALAAR